MISNRSRNLRRAIERTNATATFEHAALRSAFPLAATTSAGYPGGHDGACVRLREARRSETDAGVYRLKRDPPGSVEELQRETRVTCAPGFEVEPELAPPLPLVRSVGDDDLDHVILDLVGNAAPAVEEVP
jgi:hypothetical protein